MNRQLESIANASPDSLDRLLDDLNDSLQSTPIKDDEASALVRGLSSLLEKKCGDAALESLCNVLSTLYILGRARSEIEQIALKKMRDLPVGAVVHMLEVVGLSEISTKRELLSSYAQHENAYLSALAKSLLARAEHRSD